MAFRPSDITSFRTGGVFWEGGKDIVLLCANALIVATTDHTRPSQAARTNPLLFYLM
jgi:hypothetical protein